MSRDEDAGGKREVSLYVERHRFQPLLISKLYISLSLLLYDSPLGSDRKREKGASEHRFCQMSPPMLLQISPPPPSAASLALAVIRRRRRRRISRVSVCGVIAEPRGYWLSKAL